MRNERRHRSWQQIISREESPELLRHVQRSAAIVVVAQSLVPLRLICAYKLEDHLSGDFVRLAGRVRR
jgi:hypothetical protein